MKWISLLLALGCSVNVTADVYRWTDANGKVHYGDKKPAANADDITNKVKATNIDTSTAEHQKMETVFRKENDADRAYKAEQTQPSEDQLKRCAFMRKFLKDVSGRVVFVDEQGHDQHVTEAERKEREQQARDYIAEHCENH